MNRTFRHVAIFLGIIAPTFELFTRFCTNLFFDPLPSLFHAVAFYMVLVAIVTADRLMDESFSEKRNLWVTGCIAYAIVVSTGYSVWFLPYSWVCALGILAFGIGILGLVPYFLFAASVGLYRQWHTWLPADSRPRYQRRMSRLTLLVIPALLIFLWNPIVIKTGETMLKSDSETVKYGGLSVLHHLASQDALQQRTQRSQAFIYGAEAYDWKLPSEAYFYIYGTRPGLARNIDSWARSSGWQWDVDRGFTVVGEKQKGLVLEESALDAVVESTSAYGYYEWTMVFKNSSSFRKEARAAIQLPEYAVVSKASLWIDGEEREAAFGGTSKVREVYQRIVSARRDPLLVTMIGPDQVQLQCFPVPENGTMKVRIGITCPLQGGTRLQLPRFIESNFGIPDELRHDVWIEADAPAALTLAGEKAATSSTILSISNEDLNRTDTYLDIKVQPANEYRFSDGHLVLKRASEASSSPWPVLLIDGRNDIFANIKRLSWSNYRFLSVIVAEPFGFRSWDGKEPLLRFIGNQSAYGGVNPGPALDAAIAQARQQNAPIIWLHGPLPKVLRKELRLEQTIRRSDNPIKIVTLDLSTELNSLVSDLGYMRYFRPVSPSGDIEKDLAIAVATAQTNYAVGQNEVAMGGRSSSGMVYVGGDSLEVTHPYRLFLYSRIMQDWYEHGSVSADLTARAIESHLVTPVSGAIVLESDRQYEWADLDPRAGSENVPKIPEPEFYILLVLSIVIISAFLWKRHRLPLWRLYR